ncbi:hypothetical protein [Blastopirellula marina]|uniref:Uncharacterized protein n=1 Tax=Blastopirellula marina DSM 3645 TaxID=314230 RepID=A3ZYT6_9BACT|nr:hypothetical protein [Blastopirellula marina]EAQ78297.1 hypothetical protein DSM3645_18211 [Blastopirellula marina DSM 3645]
MSNSGISAAGNTSDPCLILLRSRGYHLWLEPTQRGSLWGAEKSGISFTGYSGPELLGVVTHGEAYPGDWNRQSPDIYGDLMELTDELPPEE